MDYYIIIPARMGSTRLFGKPLELINGKPLIQRAWERACKEIDDPGKVLIATDDPAIRQVAKGFGAEVSLLRRDPDYHNGTERVAAAAEAFGIPDNALVINWQGDLVDAHSDAVKMIRHVAEHWRTRGWDGMITPLVICQADEGVAEIRKTNAGRGGVYAVVNRFNAPVYFSRAPLISPGNVVHMHIGIYGYTMPALCEYRERGMGDLELVEGLEQMRWIDFDIPRKVAKLTYRPYYAVEVNTPQDVPDVAKYVAQFEE